jgi:hypothetical protein
MACENVYLIMELGFLEMYLDMFLGFERVYLDMLLGFNWNDILMMM